MTHPGKIQAVIFDWAGTTVDYGSRAPTEVFIEIFRRRRIDITVAESRGPMGRAKREHIAIILFQPRVTSLWREQYGRNPSDDDVEAMYVDFLPLQKETLARGCDVIPGVPGAVNRLRKMGLKIGSSTGYTRELMSVVESIAARSGYSPDVTICSDDVPAGRPAPWMNFLVAQRLGVYPMQSIVVVDDTPIGIEAGLNAGAITIAVSQTGNSLGLSEVEVAQLPPTELSRRLSEIELEFRSFGAHHVVRSASEIPDLLPTLW